MANTPLILSDNFFDATVLHPEHVVTTDGIEVAGAELHHVADNLRDVTHFTAAPHPSIGYTSIYVDCGEAKAADTLVLDRGHNLREAYVAVYVSDDGATWTVHRQETPRSTVGGLPTAVGGCLTAEGVWWMHFPLHTVRYWRIIIDAVPPGDAAPIITGLYLGAAYRFPAYLDAPGAYEHRTSMKVLKNEVSRGAVRVKRGVLLFDEVDLKLSMDEADFLAFDPHVRRLLAKNHPWWFCLDDNATEGAQRMRLFQLPGDLVYDPVVNPVHRDVRFLLEEVAPLLSL